ncbi:MAG: helix-turn-helix domain-containing protein [Clostridiales bacterium]|nr:helix-turn-helix domain-containing protein [Clostridiales bacterium]
MDIRDIREIMGLTQAQVADELGVPRQEVIDCEENGETYLLLQYISAFPINPQVLQDPDLDPFLPSFDQTTPGHRLQLWREEHQISAEDMASAIGIAPEELTKFESGEGAAPLSRRRGEEIEKKTGINRKWLMYGDGREKGSPSLQLSPRKTAIHAARDSDKVRTPAPNKPMGLRVRQARTDAGLSREDLARLLGLSVSRVIQIESGYVRDQKAEHIISRIAASSDAPLKEDPRSAGLRLREARKKAGFTVMEAAEIIQLKPTTLAHLESGYITGRHADELIEKIRSAPPKSGTKAFDPREAGIRIRDERIKAGLSQKELATILRIPVTRISMIELGNVTEKETERILLRIHGKPLREIINRRVKPTDQVILGSNIRDARVHAGLSQKELGDMLQLPQTRISMIEHGKVDEPTAKKILQMLSTLMEERESEPSSAPVSPAVTPAPRTRGRLPIQPELGKKIQEARLAAGLSQKALAERLAVSQGRISYMEQGKVDEETAETALRLIEEARNG